MPELASLLACGAQIVRKGFKHLEYKVIHEEELVARNDSILFLLDRTSST